MLSENMYGKRKDKSRSGWEEDSLEMAARLPARGILSHPWSPGFEPASRPFSRPKTQGSTPHQLRYPSFSIRGALFLWSDSLPAFILFRRL
jgi:hypothetical protein